MNPSTRQALELLREGTQPALSEEREARLRGGLEASLGLALPAPGAAAAVKAGAGVVKAFFTTTVSKTVLVAMASVAVGSAATVAATRLVRSERAGGVVVAQPRAVRGEARRAPGSSAAPGGDLERELHPEPAEDVGTAEATTGGLLPGGEARGDGAEPAEGVGTAEATTGGLLPGGEARGDGAAPETEGRVLGTKARSAGGPSTGSAAQQRLPDGSRGSRSGALPEQPGPSRPPPVQPLALDGQASRPLERPVAPTASAGAPPPIVDPLSAPPLVSADAAALRCQGSEPQTLAAATLAFEREQPLEALSVLDRQHARCPTGEWSALSWRLRIRALCALGRHAEAKGLMNWYWVEHASQARAAQAELGEACPRAVLASPSTKEPTY